MTRTIVIAALLAMLSGAAGAQPRIQSGLVSEQPALKPGDILRVTPTYTVEKIEYGVIKQLDDLEKRVQALEKPAAVDEWCLTEENHVRLPKPLCFKGADTSIDIPTPEMLKAGRDAAFAKPPVSGLVDDTDGMLTRIYRAMKAKEPK